MMVHLLLFHEERSESDGLLIMRKESKNLVQ